MPIVIVAIFTNWYNILYNSFDSRTLQNDQHPRSPKFLTYMHGLWGFSHKYVPIGLTIKKHFHQTLTCVWCHDVVCAKVHNINIGFIKAQDSQMARVNYY